MLWASNLGLFALFALVGVWRWLTGESHCACFGWQMPIAWTVLLDVGMVILLITLGRPGLLWPKRYAEVEGLSSGQGRQGSWKAYVSSRADVLGTAAGLGAVLCLIWYWQRDGLSAAVGRTLGKDVGIYGRVELAALSTGRPAVGVIRLRNVSHQSCEIVAVRSSCRCVVVTPPSPWWIAAGGESSVAVRVRPTSRGPFHERVLFYVAGPSGRPVAVDVVGWVWY